MKTKFAVLALVTGTIVVCAEETTFEKSLGVEQVKIIVNQAATNLMTETSEKYPRTVVEPILSSNVVVLVCATKITIDDSMIRYGLAKRVREGVGSFFRDYRDFVAEREKGAETMVLGVTRLKDFMEWFKKDRGCGKIPCDIPPCCGNCDSCESVTNKLR